MFDTLVTDLRYAFRNVRRSPALSCAAIVTIALGVGANAALFSLVYGILLRPLDYADADRLVAFRIEREYEGRADRVAANLSLPDLDVWRARSRSFESLDMLAGSGALLATDAGSEVVSIASVTATFFETTGARLLRGRALGPADTASPALVISARLWRRVFGSDPDVIGRQVVLDRQPYTVVGVAAPGFQLPSPASEAWQPVGFAQVLNPAMGAPGRGGFQLIGRLRRGVSLSQAQEESGVIASAVDNRLHVTPIPVRDWFVQPSIRSTLFVLLGAAGLVLLVACANVANLLLARVAARSGEIATRLALGAPRTRLIAESIAYSGLIAAAGTACGVLLAVALVRGVVALQPAGIPRLDAVRVDVPVLLFAAALACLVAIVTALVPATRSTDLLASLRGSRTAGARSGRRVRRAFVVAEIAVSCVLLVGASLLARSLVRLLESDIGIGNGQVTAALLDVSFGRQLSMDDQRALIERVVEAVSRLPGVTTAGAGASMPPNRARLRFTMNRPGDTRGQPGSLMVDAVTATPEYFVALGLRLREGRLFTQADVPGSPEVMIVTASGARQLFGRPDVVGRAIQLPTLTPQGMSSAEVTVVGVVDDVKYSGMEAPANAVVYRPFAQQPWPSMYVVARTVDDAPGLPSLMRRTIAAVDPAIGVHAIDTLDSLVSGAVAQPRFRTAVLGGIAALALALAAVGVYGVVAHATAERTNEIGVRVALGAARNDVVGLVVRDGLWMAAAGVGIGIAAAHTLRGVVAGFLYGAPSTDIVSYASAAVLLLALTAAATLLPAWRAGSLDALAALRQD